MLAAAFKGLGQSDAEPSGVDDQSMLRAAVAVPPGGMGDCATASLGLERNGMNETTPADYW
jgi:hypothetical protein